MVFREKLDEMSDDKKIDLLINDNITPTKRLKSWDGFDNKNGYEKETIILKD